MLRVAPFLVAAAVCLGLWANDVAAHSSGCHSAHSCPSDHHTYVWYDGRGQGWSCAEPGAAEYDPSRDTTTITYDGRTYYCYPVGSAPPPADTDGDGVADTSDACPYDYALTADGCPAPPAAPKPKRKVYMGRPADDSLFALPRAFKPRQLHPFSADDNAYLYGLHWKRWGKSSATAKGKGKANDCIPACAGGHFVRRRGARVRAYRLRNGTCHGRPARFYTRARLRFPRGLHVGTLKVKLTTGCSGD